MAQMVTPFPDLIALQREAVKRGGLGAFMRRAFAQLEPRPYQHNWHHDVIAEHLEAVLSGEIRRLIINVSPGFMKSLSVSVMFPAYAWIKDPGLKFIYGAYGDELALRDAVKHRDLVQSKWYQDRWGLGWESWSRAIDQDPGTVCYIPKHSVKKAREFFNSGHGFRFSTSPGGPATGRHGDILVLDDPTKAAKAGAFVQMLDLDKAWDFWNSTLPTRQANPITTRKIVIMQRLHEKDVCGRIAELEEQGGDTYDRLIIPMRYEPKVISHTRLGFVDPRSTPGELAWPERYPEAEVKSLEKTLGPMGTAAQLDQTPSPAAGAIFRRNMLTQEWAAIPSTCKRWIQVWDCTFTDEVASDYVVGQVWATDGQRFYLVDQVRDQMDIVATMQSMEGLTAKWPQSKRERVIENKANGPAVISMFRRRGTGGLIAWPPKGTPHPGKVEKAHAVVPIFAAGDVFLPPATLAPWIGDFREELAKFPRGANDDQVDGCTMAILHLCSNDTASRYRRAAGK